MVESIEELPIEWQGTLQPYMPKNLPKGESFNGLQLALFHYMVSSKNLKGNKEAAELIIQKGRKLKLWSSTWKPAGTSKCFRDYLIQKINNIYKRNKLSMTKKKFDPKLMNSQLEQQTSSFIEAECSAETRFMALEDPNNFEETDS